MFDKDFDFSEILVAPSAAQDNKIKKKIAADEQIQTMGIMYCMKIVTFGAIGGSKLRPGRTP